MKISLVSLNSNLISSENQTSVIRFLTKKLYEIGENISLISYFDNSIDKLKSIFAENYDVIFLIGTMYPIYNHNIKDNLSRIFGEKLETNGNCSNYLNTYCSTYNIPFSIQEDMEVKLPTNSIPLCDKDHYNNGFMYKFGNTYVIYFPDDLQFAQKNYFNYVLPLLKDLVSINKEYQVIKCFGILEKDIKALISDYFAVPNLTITIVSSDLDNAVYLRYESNCNNLSQIQDAIADIISKLNKFIYSLEDISLYDMAIELLKVQNKKVTLGETLTFGNITQKLASIDSDRIQSSSIFLNFNDMASDLKIENETIKTYGKYSVNTIYECANSLLENKSGEIVLFVLGESTQINGICYVAVGDIDGIHVYKNKINVSDNVCENLSKTAIFYLIKKLKQNDLHFM